MTNSEKYLQIFTEVFAVTETEARGMKYKDGSWDSVGHMMLITSLEDAFGIEIETDDVLAFDSYRQGLEILKKYVTVRDTDEDTKR